MAIQNVSASTTVNCEWYAQATLTGFSPNIHRDSRTKSLTMYDGESGQVYGSRQVLTGGQSVTLDLTSLTNVCNQSFAFSSIKGVFVQLLSADELDVETEQSSGISVGNASSSQALTGMVGGNSEIIKVQNDNCFFWSGSQVIDSSHKNWKILNDDAADTANINVILIGE